MNVCACSSEPSASMVAETKRKSLVAITKETIDIAAAAETNLNNIISVLIGDEPVTDNWPNADCYSADLADLYETVYRLSQKVQCIKEILCG